MLQAVYSEGGTPLSSREGSRVVHEDGHIYIKKEGHLEPANLTEAEEGKVKKMLAIRDLGKKLVDLEVRNQPDSELLPAQAEILKLYKEYVLENGPLSAPESADLLENDPDEPFLQALENHDALDTEKNRLTPEISRMIKVLKGKEKVQEGDIDKLEMPIFKKRVIHGMEDRPVNRL